MKPKQGKIIAISISKERGTPKTNVPAAHLVDDWGIEEDAHAGHWHRQVSLLALSSVEKMQALGAQVAPGAFAENLTLDGIDVPNLHIGDRLMIREVLLEVTQIGKECHARCEIFQQVGDCVMPREGVFVRVLAGGDIRVGDAVSLFRPQTTKP